MVKSVARSEAMLVGISTGASLAAVRSLIESIPAGSRILTFAYDGGERYMSIEGLWS